MRLARVFTFEEAQALLPELGASLRQARESAVRASTFENEMQELSQRIFLSGGMHVDVSAAARRRAERDKAVQIARTAIQEIETTGVRVADVEEGRLEFPYELDGREVLLCWTLGEDSIRQWREDEEDSPLRSIGDGTFRRDRDRPN